MKVLVEVWESLCFYMIGTSVMKVLVEVCESL